ncbi:MAG TPA: hypothetical protein VHQ47_08750 [Phycisphaerae bacterium]|jgi:hypothetical protein|nr:hypothetical protein [Phycisphaerae bacterium]
MSLLFDAAPIPKPVHKATPPPRLPYITEPQSRILEKMARGARLLQGVMDWRLDDVVVNRRECERMRTKGLIVADGNGYYVARKGEGVTLEAIPTPTDAGNGRDGGLAGNP